jgi:B12-binding domain/radical SAM domain protein
LRALRALDRRLVAIAGGAHPSADPAGTLALGFDVVCCGEGEQVFPGILRDLAAGCVADQPIRRADRRGFDLDCGLHLEPSLGLFPFVEISRGCPFACAFCQVGSTFGRRMRHRSPAVAAAGVGLAVRAGFARFRFLSPDAFAYGGPKATRRDAIEELLIRCREAGARELFLGAFPAEVRPDRVEPELLALVGAHCKNRTLVIGAQSGSDALLERMQRGHTVEQARRAARLTREAGLVPHVDVLFGFPSEQPEDRQATVELIDWLIQHTGARIHAHVYLPLPGTPAWPRPPEVLEPGVLRRLAQFEQTGRFDGDWRRQAVDGRRILRWREQGRIRV